jgi:osmotically-inducible protein OsmY
MQFSQFIPAKSITIKLLLSIAIVTSTAACVPAVVGGAAAGTSAAIDRRTTGIFVEDENIEIKAVRKMETNLGEESHVNVTSFNQNVLLTGEVPDPERKAKAESLMKEVEQVRSVTNEIVVSPKTDLSTRANDTYLTSKVKTTFLTENKFQANYVKVVTENSVVYLMGLVTKEEADAAVAIASSTSGVEKVVKVFEYIN